MVSIRTVRKIRCGVVAGHLLVVLLVLTCGAVSDWLDQKEEMITIQFYDPALDNVVENPSPLPDPANPSPPSGTQDGSVTEPVPNDPAPPATPPEPEISPEPEINPEPVRILTPEPVQAIVQPKVKKRSLPKPKINKNLPQAQKTPQVQALKQPKVKKRSLPQKPDSASSRRNADNIKPVNSNTPGSSGNKGPLGSNSQPGHTAPGGQKGNSGYDIQVAMMIKRMWVTPDRNRLGGREPRVMVEIRIAPDGRVTDKRIRQSSGVLAMDESIAALLNNLKWVKAPFDGKPHNLVFWIRADNN